jgi:hypothetical protein
VLIGSIKGALTTAGKTQPAERFSVMLASACTCKRLIISRRQKQTQPNNALFAYAPFSGKGPGGTDCKKLIGVIEKSVLKLQCWRVGQKKRLKIPAWKFFGLEEVPSPPVRNQKVQMREAARIATING